MWESVLLGCALMSPRSWGDSVHLAWRIEELGLEEILPAAPFAPALFQRHDRLSAPYGRGSEADKCYRNAPATGEIAILVCN
jgi:hypothetical protein